jgi:tetratricopeptide (TPR) repeat protein
MTMMLEFQPYVGPKSFEEKDKDLFFGRDAEANDFFSLIVAHQVVLIYAQSGAGKTSLLNAKIIPSLKGKGYEVLPLARVQGIQTDEASNIYVFNTLQSWSSGKNEESDNLADLSLAKFLKKRSHAQRLKDVPVNEGDNGHPSQEPEEEEPWELPRIAVFDQFEELFTSYPHRWQQREEFFKQVREALDDDYLLRVVFLMREDYIAELDPYVCFLPGNLRVRERLERLDEDAALEAVVKPLQFTKRKFGDGVAHTLVQNLMKSSNGRPGVEQFVEAVQLQVVCQSLWQSLEPKDTVITKDHLEECGDVDQALMSFYEKSIRNIVGEDGLADGKQRITEGDLRRWFEKILITPEQKRATVDRREKHTGGMPNDTVVVPLERVQLIKGEWRAGARWYELSHDRFIDPILTSNRNWLAKQSLAAQTHQRLEDRAIEYAQGTGGLLNQDELLEAKRLLAHQSRTHITPSRHLRHLYQASLIPEQRRKMRTMRLAVAGAVIVVVLMALLTTWAGIATRDAMHQRKNAETASEDAIKSKNEAEDRRKEAEGLKTKAEEQTAEAEKLRTEAEKRKTEAENALAEAKEATRNARQATMAMEFQKKLADARAEDLNKDRLRDQALVKAESWNTYGFGLFQGGTPDTTEKAIKAHNEALKQYQSLHDAAGEANTLTYLGRAYVDQARPVDASAREDKYAKAEDYYRQALALRETISPERNELARANNYLAIVYDEQDKPDKDVEAEKYYRRGLNIREKIFEEGRNTNSVGPAFFAELASNYRNLAALYQELGKYAEGMEMTAKARKVSELIAQSNDDKRDLGLSLNQMGVIDYFQGNYKQAESLFKEALKITESQRETQPAVMASNWHNLALVYFQLARYREAEQLENQSVEVKLKATNSGQASSTSFISNHDGLSVSYVTLARIYRELGNIPAAKEKYQQAVDEMITARGADGRRVAIMKNYQAEFYAAEGQNLPLAERLEQEALTILKKGFQSDHWFVSRSQSTLAGIRAQQAKRDEAESLYKQALVNLKEKLGPDHPEVAATQTGLAQLYISEYRYAEAEPLLKGALAIRERIEPNHPYVADVLETYYTLLQRTGRETEAKEMSARAQAIRQKVRAAYENH